MPAPLRDHGDAVDRLARGRFNREVIVDDGRHLARQRLGAEIGGVIEQPLGDLAQACGCRREAGRWSRDRWRPAPRRGPDPHRQARRQVRRPGPRRSGCSPLGKPRQQRVEGGRPPEIVTQLQPPALGQRQRIEQRVEQRDVAEAEAELLQPGAAHRIGDEQHDLGIGAVAVGDAETFDAGLAELARMRAARALRLKAEGRAVIAIAGLRHRRAGDARDRAATPAR